MLFGFRFVRVMGERFKAVSTSIATRKSDQPLKNSSSSALRSIERSSNGTRSSKVYVSRSLGVDRVHEGGKPSNLLQFFRFSTVLVTPKKVLGRHVAKSCIFSNFFSWPSEGLKPLGTLGINCAAR